MTIKEGVLSQKSIFFKINTANDVVAIDNKKNEMKKKLNGHPIFNSIMVAADATIHEH